METPVEVKERMKKNRLHKKEIDKIEKIKKIETKESEL